MRSEQLVVDEIPEKLSLLICRVGLVGNGADRILEEWWVQAITANP